MFGFWYLFIVSVIILIIGIVALIKEWDYLITFVCISISGAGTFIFFILAIVLPEIANDNISFYRNKQQDYVLYVDFLNNNSFNSENEERMYLYMSEIRKYNEWLSEATNSQATQGCFSIYYNKDLSDFNYINIFVTE